MSKTLSVSAINNGTVIDHIVPGQALRIIHLLRLLDNHYRVTVGLNLSSGRMKLKDIIKIENYTLSNEQANEITIFAPDATINIIKDFEVVEKITTQLPASIVSVFECPNPACITQAEPIQTVFRIEEQSRTINLICNYCEKTFNRNQVAVKI